MTDSGDRREARAGEVRLGIVGCGNIARPYVAGLLDYERARVVGVHDIDLGRASVLAEQANCPVYETFADLLKGSSADVIVNLTQHQAHHEVTREALLSGKHVYSEKPLALTAAEANELVALAESRGLRLACSPFTFLGQSQQLAWRLIDEGRLGRVRLVYAEVNWGRIESWHPEPAGFYKVGPLFDVGVYPLTLLTAIFGPARKVIAYGRVLHGERINKRGQAFEVEKPDFVSALIELGGGPVVRLTANFYVPQEGKQRGVEFHGDEGSLHLADWQNPDGAVEFAAFGEAYGPVAFEPSEKMSWGRGVRELVDAMVEGRPHRVTGEQAAHTVEILEATARSIELERPVEISSSFARLALAPL